MWEEVRSLTERARAVFRGEEAPNPASSHTTRPSASSLRAVAHARENEPRIQILSAPPNTSERPRQFPCVVCDVPTYAHRCTACGGYACPTHMGKDDEWCELCRDDYEEAGIPQIRPAVSTLLGAAMGTLLAAAFFGAASAGAQRPMRLMLGPTLMLMLLGMLAGVAHRWVRRWWFLTTRPNRRSLVPPSIESLLESAASGEGHAFLGVPGGTPIVGAGGAPLPARRAEPRPSLVRPEIPAAPAVPDLDTPPVLGPSLPPPSRPRERLWMSRPPRSAPPGHLAIFPGRRLSFLTLRLRD
jgi:hypothetical protein